jgi:hypothetical protein
MNIQTIELDRVAKKAFGNYALSRIEYTFPVLCSTASVWTETGTIVVAFKSQE